MLKNITIVAFGFLALLVAFFLFTLNNSEKIPSATEVINTETLESSVVANEEVSTASYEEAVPIKMFNTNVTFNKENTSMSKEYTIEISGVTYDLFVDPKISKYVTDFEGANEFIDKHKALIEAEVAKASDTIVLVKELGASNDIEFTIDMGASFAHTFTLVIKKNEAKAGLFVNNPRGLVDLDNLLTNYNKNIVDDGKLFIYEIDDKKYFVNQDAITSYAEVIKDRELVDLMVPPILSKLIFYTDPSIFIGDGSIYGVVGNVTFVEKNNYVYITITKDFFDENKDY